MRHLHLTVTVQHACVPFVVEVSVNRKLKGHTFKTIFKSKQSRKMARIISEKKTRDLIKKILDLEKKIKKENIIFFPNI
jgi:hypothetical protein